MIKGVSRQVIEVGETGSIYYERVWLMVKPQYTQIHESILQKEAKQVIADMGQPSCMKKKRSIGFWAIRMGLSACTGSVLTMLIQSLV